MRNLKIPCVNIYSKSPHYSIGLQPRISILDLYKPYFLERVNTPYPEWIPAVVLYQEILELGYLGKVRIDLKGISCNIITSHHTETLNCSTVLKNMAFAPAYVSATLHKSKIKLNALMDTSNQALLCY